MEILQLLKVAAAVIVVGCSFLLKNASMKKAILIAWMIGPPVFFFFEYYFFADVLSKEGALQTFKDYQSLASAIWAGVAAALAIAYFKE